LTPVPQVHDARTFQCLHESEFDALRRKAVEEPPPSAEKDGYELDLHLVEQPGPEAPLCRERAVQHDVPVPGGGLGLRHTRLDTVGDESDMAGWVTVRRGVRGTKIGAPS
jgi:hypothetical protein